MFGTFSDTRPRRVFFDLLKCLVQTPKSSSVVVVVVVFVVGVGIVVVVGGGVANVTSVAAMTGMAGIGVP